MKYILSISLIMSLFGCGNSGQIEQELSTAAKLMRSEPDSSLRIIENIDPDRILDATHGQNTLSCIPRHSIKIMWIPMMIH